jgi:hypothetical protein
MRPILCCLVCIPNQWDINSFGLHEHAEGSIQGFRSNFTKVSSLYTLIGRQHFSFIVNSILILLHLKTVSRCTTLIDSIMASNLRAGSGWQSDMTSSVSNNPWALSIMGQYMVNREKVSYYYVLYLLNLSSNIFTFCVLINVLLCCCSLLINNRILLFFINIIIIRRNLHILLIRICKRTESIMLYPTCVCSCAMRYSMHKEGSSTRMTH